MVYDAAKKITFLEIGMSEMMNEYLVNLLLKIGNYRIQGNHDVYNRENFSNPDDALREEDGLLELRVMIIVSAIEAPRWIPKEMA